MIPILLPVTTPSPARRVPALVEPHAARTGFLVPPTGWSRPHLRDDRDAPIAEAPVSAKLPRERGTLGVPARPAAVLRQETEGMDAMADAIERAREWNPAAR